MTDLEEALTRTLRERGRPRPSRTDPLPAIRARARTQRRHGAVAAVVLLLLVAAVVVPASLARSDRALPTATGSEDGLLNWAARGDLTGDADLVRAAERTWRASTTSRRIGTVRVLYAGRVGAARVVLLQAVTSDGPAMAQLTEKDGTMGQVAAGLVPSPAPAVLRLVDPDPQPYRVLLLARPDAGAVVLSDLTDGGFGPDGELGSDGLVVLDKADDSRPQLVVAVDQNRRPLDSNLLPPAGGLSAPRGEVTLVRPTWDPARALGPTGPAVLDGLLLAERLGGPVEVAQLADPGIGRDLSGTLTAFPRYYEVHRDGQRYLASLVSVQDRPDLMGGRNHCLSVQPYAGAGPDAVVLRCVPPGTGRGVLGVLARSGVRSGRLTLGGTSRPLPLGWEPYLEVTDPAGVTGPGRLTLTGARGPLPTVELAG